MAKRYSLMTMVLGIAALCANACSSSGSGGTGGATGTDAATGGATGTGGATATGGATGTGGAATDAGHDTVADTSGGDTSIDATGDAAVLAALCPAAPTARNALSPSMTAAQYCMLYLQTCGGANMPDGGYTSEATCETAFAALAYETTRECRSYHVCNAAVYNPASVALHCGHSIGIGLCGDVAVDAGPTDAASGN